MIGPPLFDGTHYVPALSIKDAEIHALEGAEDASVSCTPLFFLAGSAYETEVLDASGKRTRAQRPPQPDEVQADVATAAKRLRAWCKDLRPTRGPDCPRFFVDVVPYDDFHSVEVLRDLLRELDNCASAVPVAYLERPWQHPVVAEHHRKTGAGTALRLINLPRATGARINRALERCGVTIENTDLIVDFGNVLTGAEFRKLRRAASAYVLALHELGRWRTMTLLVNAMPKVRHENVKDPYSEWPLVRYDWFLWQAVRKDLSRLDARIPTFGDYATRNVQNFGLMFNQPPALLIYTRRRSWWLARRPARGGSSAPAWKEMATQCVAIPQFRGRDYSYFEDRVFRCANDLPIIGRHTLADWISAMIGHHLIFVSREIVSLA